MNIFPTPEDTAWLNKMADLEEKHGTPSVPLSAPKEKFCCPECGLEGKLTKKKDTGEGVKHCEKCSSSWFILKTSRGK